VEQHNHRCNWIQLEHFSHNIWL